MPIHNHIAAFHKDMTAWRGDLRPQPELALEEHRTRAMIQAKLKGLWRRRDHHRHRPPTVGREDSPSCSMPIWATTSCLAPEKPTRTPKVHSPDYDFNDDLLPIGARYWATPTEQLLSMNAR
jgi:metal-dependent amidase/aminoacylase/carboxypeptidase family protein